MVEIPPQLMNFLRDVGYLFQVRPEWLLFPNVITIFAVPLVLNVLMFHFMIRKVIPQFPAVASVMIAGVMGFLALPYNQITVFVAPAVIGFLGPSRFIVKIIVAAALYAAVLLVLPAVFGEIASIRF